MSEYERHPDGHHLIVPLPDGHHAEVYDPEDMRQRHVNAALLHADESGVNLITRLGFGDIVRLQQALVVTLTRRWSLVDKHPETGDETQRPVTRDTILDLKPAQYRRLRNAVLPGLKFLTGNDEDEPDPKSGSTSGPSSSPPVNPG